MVLKDLVSLGDFASLWSLSGHGLVFLLKHSLTCPVSSFALSVFSEFSGRHSSVPCFVLRVQEAGNVSDRVAVVTGVGHESPQVLLFRDGGVVWSANHTSISLGSLESALKKYKA